MQRLVVVEGRGDSARTRRPHGPDRGFRLVGQRRPVSAQTVRVWRTCRDSINGECVGGWNETHAPSLAVVGAVCLVAGLIVVAVHWLLRRRYSDLELMPRLLDIGTQVSLAALGAVLLIGGATRSSLDDSWHWVPLWLPVGVACIGAALLLHRSDVRRSSTRQVISAELSAPEALLDERLVVRAKADPIR
jgi:hypothetical protein